MEGKKLKFLKSLNKSGEGWDKNLISLAWIIKTPEELEVTKTLKICVVKASEWKKKSMMNTFICISYDKWGIVLLIMSIFGVIWIIYAISTMYSR